MYNLEGKKLLILGGTALSCEIIKQAKAKGIYVIVTDYLKDSPGKKVADKSFMISTTDIDAVVNLIKEEHIDGVLTGFIDSMLPYYQQICQRAGLHCYSTMEQIKISTNKQKFKELCREFDVPVVEEYTIDNSFKPENLNDGMFPVLIKPVDNSGGRGIRVCDHKHDFLVNYEKALLFSPGRQVLVERYMTGKEATIFYIAQNGEIYLSAMADRYTKHKQDGIIPLPVAYIFPSVNLQTYQECLNEKVIAMFKSIGIQNGMIFIQSFIQNGECIFYEMGFRLTGSLEYKILSRINGINPLDMMINYALTGQMDDTDIRERVNPDFKEWGCNITFSAKPGKIEKITGINEVASLNGVIDVISAYNEGDIIPQEALGTLKQVVIRVLAYSSTKQELTAVIDKIQRTIKVYSENGENMLLQPFDTRELIGQEEAGNL